MKNDIDTRSAPDGPEILELSPVNDSVTGEVIYRDLTAANGSLISQPSAPQISVLP